MAKSANCITILGASGFIGSQLVKRLRDSAADFFAPERSAQIAGRPLGHVIYCIGLTSDFRSRPLDTVDAHVCELLRVLKDYDFESLLYLSSTRLYNAQLTLARETDAVQVNPSDPSDLYNISKLMGESLALSSGKKVRIARVSNVYGGDFGSDNFLSSIIRDALTKGRIALRTSPDSEKDYVSIDDVTEVLLRIARGGKHEIYNLASGVNVSNRALLEAIRRITNCEVEFLADAPQMRFPPSSIDRVRQEFGFSPRSVLEDLEGLVSLYRSWAGEQDDQN
jgi:nucleoside-diphosphate-sugar epimerase